MYSRPLHHALISPSKVIKEFFPRDFFTHYCFAEYEDNKKYMALVQIALGEIS
jgi:hypothetical protein